MNNPNRDTQFAGFAKLLCDELKAQWMQEWKFTEEMQRITAQRAYDLVAHVLMTSPTIALEGGASSRSEAEEMISMMSDMPALPEETNE